jgi:hypothetical protein
MAAPTITSITSLGCESMGTWLLSASTVVAPIHQLADRLKDEHQAAAAERLGDRPDLFSDLLAAALSEVSWHDIAEHLLTP